jgi:hypothetical protein
MGWCEGGRENSPTPPHSTHRIGKNTGLTTHSAHRDLVYPGDAPRAFPAKLLGAGCAPQCGTRTRVRETMYYHAPPPRFHSPPRNTTTPGNRSRNARAASGPELTESPLIVNPSPSPPRAHMCTSGHQGSRSGETGGGNESPPPRSLSFFPGSPPSQRTAVLNGVFYAPHKTTPLEGCHRH